MDNRKHERVAVAFKVTVHHDDRIVAGELHNISAGGARIKADDSFEVKTLVNLKIDRFGTYPCEIVRSDKSDIGVRFTKDQQTMGEVAYAMAVYGPDTT